MRTYCFSAVLPTLPGRLRTSCWVIRAAKKAARGFKSRNMTSLRAAALRADGPRSLSDYLFSESPYCLSFGEARLFLFHAIVHWAVVAAFVFP